jgi:hypothetical protein
MFLGGGEVPRHLEVRPDEVLPVHERRAPAVRFGPMKAVDVARRAEILRREERRAAEKRRNSAIKALRADNLRELARIHKSA